MKNLKGILSAAAFTVAIGGAFASQFAVVKLGYTRKVDVGSSQAAICQSRINCDELGTFDCTTVINGNTYQLYERTSTAPVICETPLKRSVQ